MKVSAECEVVQIDYLLEEAQFIGVSNNKYSTISFRIFSL